MRSAAVIHEISSDHSSSLAQFTNLRSCSTSPATGFGSGSIPRFATNLTGGSATTRWPCAVTSIASPLPSAKSIKTSDGEELGYDNLLLATGSTPLGLPVDGSDLSGVTAQWSLAHVEKGLEILEGKPNPRVVLVGGGFIGFIILSALHKRGCQLTVVERESHVLPKMLSSASFKYSLIKFAFLNFLKNLKPPILSI